MNPGRLCRCVVDIAMALCLILLMGYKMAPNGLHEFAGMGLFLLAVVHCVLNRGWFAALFKGRYTLRRILAGAVNLLLLTALTVQVLTALPISETVFAFLGIAKDPAAVEFHGVAGTWMFVLGAVHLGFHWAGLLRAFRRRADTRTVVIWLVRAMGLLLMTWGIKASFDRTMGSRLLFNEGLHAMFSDPSVFRFIRDYLAIAALYTGTTHYILKLLQWIKNKTAAAKNAQG
ncbi:DUF4405 domain-containing protein [Brucepastera parasyntrophica]|uniref:DUF4405 domain-containing protein n=1 Tax=Brucepastera parasyntrophica TaxID=2880008 RepID=UPI0021093F7A|nr:DUF4405 domain-containing protein [Brucepastera parasyntrophica]ULQ60433.1 DUF4405 domain-containing protein [Brucepastera parasyntrophica]